MNPSLKQNSVINFINDLIELLVFDIKYEIQDSVMHRTRQNSISFIFLRTLK